MKIYLASSLSKGHTVYAPVEHFIEDAWSYPNREWGRMVFENDIRAIRESDIVVAVSYGRTGTTAGSSWETGYSYGIGKKVVVVEMDEGPQSLMVSNGSWATVKGLEGILDYDFDSMERTMTDSEQK